MKRQATCPPTAFHGELLRPSDRGYAKAVAISNQRVQGSPALIARCAQPSDVQAALELAHAYNLEVSVRGGGHSVAGWGSNDGGLVIDLTLMRAVKIDPATRTARIGGGAQAGDLLVEAARHGLTAVTAGARSVGVAGTALGRGESYLAPKHGFVADNVLAFELVQADGTRLRADADTRPDLFRAMRGGAGPNFGVVTALELRLHPAPEDVLGGMLMFPGEAAEALARHAWQTMRQGSEHSWPQVVFSELGVMVVPGHTGPVNDAERELGKLRRAATPVADQTRRMSYVDLVFLHPDAPGRRHWELVRFSPTEDADLQRAALLEHVRALRQGRSIALWPTAGPRGIAVFITSRWEDPTRDAAEVAWVERTAAELQATGLVGPAASEPNHVARVDATRARRLFGPGGYTRLQRLKALHDPENVFHRNYNIAPATTEPSELRGGQPNGHGEDIHTLGRAVIPARA